MNLEPLKRLWHRRAWRIAIVGLAVSVVVFGLLRYGIGYGVKLWLLSHEPEQIRVKSLDLNPFTGKLTIHNLSITVTEAPTLVVPEARLSVAVLPLLFGRRRVEFETLTLTGAQITFQQEADGTWRIAGLPLPVAEGKKRDTTHWEFDFQQALVSGSRIVLLVRGIRAELGLDQVALTGQVRVQPQGTEINLRADAVFSNLLVDSTERQVRLLRANKIKGEGIRVTGPTTFDSSRIRIDDLSLGQYYKPPETEKRATTPTLISSPTVILDNVGFDKSGGLNITSIQVNDPNLFARRDKQGRWVVLDDIRRAMATAPAAPKKKSAEPVPRIRIGSVKTSGKGLIRFEDDSVEPPYHQNLQLREMRLSNFDSGTAQQPSSVTLGAQIDKYTHISLRGLLWPFTPRLTLDIEGKIESLDLPPLSPYSKRELGYNLKSGHLNVETQLRARQGKLDGNNTLVINNLEVSPADKEKMKELTKQLTMPLDAALSMLRDKDNNIKLTFPITGDSGDPKFDLGDAINVALGKAIKTASMTYLKYYFQPFGTLITIAELAGKAAQVRLDPVFFAPASVELGENALKYLDRVAGLIKEQPKLKLNICGLAAPADATAGTEDLTALAQKRATTVKDHLVVKHRLDPAQLFVCRPEVSSKADDRARVDLSF
jgi:outer membrane protein OmpA-like peptidoglycan-associated protein